MRFLALAALAAALVCAQHARAQAHVDVRGLAFGDYYYVFDSPTATRVDDNGFTLRRAYLTADFRLSDRYDGRLRFEANQGSLGARGMEAFVKDLYVRRKSRSGHAISIGIMPPPLFELSESVWGHRSLEATILDFTGVADSRDFGVRLDGPVLDESRLEYSLMFGNNNAIRPENDRGKRLYGQLRSLATEHLAFSAAVDYAGPSDGRDRGLTLHGFAGYRGGRGGAGIEPYWSRVEYTAGGSETLIGVSLFAHRLVTDRWRLVGRVDYTDIDRAGEPESLVLGVVGVAYEPDRNVRFIPNLWITRYETADTAELRGRFTFEFSF